MSTLRKYQADPKHLLNTALSLYRSKKIRTVVVEGISDKKFLCQWQKKDSPIRYDGFDGKPLVENTYLAAQKKPFLDYDFLFYFADVDYDGVANLGLHFHPRFIYNAYCFDSENLLYNDLEVFLVNTRALSKLLVNYNFEFDEIDCLRSRLETASRKFGSLRAADILIQKKERLTSSVLNGLEVSEFFDPVKVEVDEERLLKNLGAWSNKKHFIEDLKQIAKALECDWPASWSLSRGHDVTEMLYLHLEARENKGLNRTKVELMLRLACEISEYRSSPMGQKLLKSGAADCFLSFN